MRQLDQRHTAALATLLGDSSTSLGFRVILQTLLSSPANDKQHHGTVFYEPIRKAASQYIIISWLELSYSIHIQNLPMKPFRRTFNVNPINMIYDWPILFFQPTNDRCSCYHTQVENLIIVPVARHPSSLQPRSRSYSTCAWVGT